MNIHDTEELATYLARTSNTVYFDMDGVLANWAGRVAELFGRDYNSVCPHGHGVDKELNVSKSRIWKAVSGLGVTFWRNLPPLKEGVALWRELQQRGHDICVLTSPSRDPSSGAGKMAWIQKHLRFDPQEHQERFIITSQKWRLARRGDVLLDDALKHVSAWRDHDGTAYLWPGDVKDITDVRSV